MTCGLLLRLEHVRQIPQRKVVLLIGLEPVALAEKPADLRLRVRHVLTGPDLDVDGADRARGGLALTEHLLLRRRKCNQDDVVLVRTMRALPLPPTEWPSRSASGQLLTPLGEAQGPAGTLLGRPRATVISNRSTICPLTFLK